MSVLTFDSNAGGPVGVGVGVAVGVGAWVDVGVAVPLGSRSDAAVGVGLVPQAVTSDNTATMTRFTCSSVLRPVETNVSQWSKRQQGA
ncbi:hypothetical protein GCM10010404_79710 [Nonomuraea africana]